MRNIQVWLLSALMLLSAGVQAGTSVWQVEKGGNLLYLGGSIHVAMQDSPPISNAYFKALNDSEVLVLETDLDEMQQPAFAKKALAVFMDQQGRPLSSLISTSTYQQLQEYLSGYRIPIKLFETATPAGVYLTLTEIEMKRIGAVLPGTDKVMHAEAKKLGKRFGKLETPDEQLALLGRLGKNNPDRFISNVLEHVDTALEDMRAIENAWQKGDRRLLAEETIRETREKYPVMYEDMIVRRNLNWMPQIIEMADSAEREFVLVGVGHLVGPDGLLGKLEAAGYTVRQMD